MRWLKDDATDFLSKLLTFCPHLKYDVSDFVNILLSWSTRITKREKDHSSLSDLACSGGLLM